MKKYEKPEIEITVFDSIDIIMASSYSLASDSGEESPTVDLTNSSMSLSGDGSNELIASPSAGGENSGSVSELPSETNGEQVDTPLVDANESAGSVESEPVVEDPVPSADNTDVPEIAQEDSASVTETVETPVD